MDAARADLASVLKNAFADPRASDDFYAGLADLLADKTRDWANDVCAFSRHAKRKTVTAEDVLLLARRNPVALEKLRAIYETDMK